MRDEAPDAGRDEAIPPFYCPIAPAVHPDVRLVDEHALEWVCEHFSAGGRRIRSRLEHVKGGSLAAYQYPDGNLQAVQAIGTLHCWGFVFDDVIEHSAADQLTSVADRHFGLVRFTDRPECAVLADDPFARAFREIWNRFKELSSPAVFRRWVEHNRRFALGVVWGCIYRQAGLVPTPDTVTSIRLLDAGGPNYGTGLIELANGFEVPADDIAHPDVRLLTDIVDVILAWDNDIYSYSTEVEHEIDHINVVTALTRHEALSPPQALVEAVRLRNRAMWCYLRHRDRVRTSADRTLSRYLTGLDHQLRGHLDWVLGATHRYDTRHAGRPALSLYEQPTDSILGCDLTRPVELPTVRWWWDATARAT